MKISKLFVIPEEEPTVDEIKAIKESQKEYENGETLSFTIDELRKVFLKNE